MSAPYGEFESLFTTTTAGGHPGPEVLIMRRPDGVVLRIGDAEAFIAAVGQCEQLADVLMDVGWTAQLEARATVQPKDFKRWEREL